MFFAMGLTSCGQEQDAMKLAEEIQRSEGALSRRTVVPKIRNLG